MGLTATFVVIHVAWQVTGKLNLSPIRDSIIPFSLYNG